jgi:hypothetical protein
MSLTWAGGAGSQGSALFGWLSPDNAEVDVEPASRITTPKAGTGAAAPRLFRCLLFFVRGRRVRFAGGGSDSASPATVAACGADLVVRQLIVGRVELLGKAHQSQSCETNT